MQLQITLDGNEGPEVARRVIAAVESLYDLSATVSLRVGGELRDTLSALAGAAAVEIADTNTDSADAATIGFGTGATGEVAAAAAPATANGVAVDADGLPWDARINSNPPKQNADGRWKKKKGVQDALVQTVQTELRSLMQVVAPAPAATAAAVPPPPPATEAAAVPPPPATTEAAAVPPPPPATPAAAATDAPTTFAQLMVWIGPRMQSRKLTPDVVAAQLATLGVAQLASLAQRPDLVPGVFELLRTAAGE